MNEILNIAEDLAIKVEKSQLYQEYLYYKEQLMQKPQLWGKMQRMKTLQMEIGQKRRNQEFVSFEEETFLSELYSQAMLDENAAGFWRSRQQMLQLEAKIFQIIAEGAPIDMIFLQEGTQLV